MDARVQEVFARLAKGARNAAEHLQNNQKETEEVIGLVVNKLNEFASVLEAQTGAAASSNTSGGTPEDKFSFIYENESDRVFKNALLKSKTFLLENLDVLEKLYRSAKGQ